MNGTDLRVIKTQQQIEQAFLSLIIEKGYRAITVQDILDKALINRSTFYRHYPSKQALAEQLVNEFRKRYEQFLHERFNYIDSENLHGFINEFMQFVVAQKQKILALWQIKTPSIHLYNDMYDLIKRQFVSYATAHYRQGNLDYQGHMYAVLILNNLDYILKNNVPSNIAFIRSELALMLATAKMQRNSNP